MSPLEQDSRERPVIPNVLADRYASTPICYKLVRPKIKVRQERNLWVVIMQGQKRSGTTHSSISYRCLQSVKDHVDLESIRKRELELQHDEKARIDEFNALAGFEDIHKGLTSRDVSDNLEQMQIRDSLIIIRDRTVATLARDARLAVDYDNLVYAGRTHNAPAQPSIIGKNFSDSGEELLHGFNRLEELIDSYPLRGIKGAMGTQTDLLQLFDGDVEKSPCT